MVKNIEEIEKNPILRHAFELALMIEGYCDDLHQMKKYDLARQLFRAGTSVGANIFEAQAPESNSDFIHKLKIAQKEVNETMYWLLICTHSKGYPDATGLMAKLEEVSKLLSAIIATSKKKLNTPSNPLKH